MERKRFERPLSARADSLSVGGADEITKTVKMLKPLKLLLGITDDSNERLLLFLIDNAVELILGYCRIVRLPERLYSIVPELAADMYRAKGYGAENAPDVVKSVSVGARSVTYADKALESDILSGYYQRLRPYVSRRGRVPSEV